ncbi:MAG: tRNA preQ1(34) S-adenosylmethionine ribosyltransferase-isomerase QueA [Deltaproteobacteria bacterium]|nr:tRNA preQ1(34) S-adenosylmethionine ribosyltransferase-isomerase QueA [Deltaproteobacteria bacterium]
MLLEDLDFELPERLIAQSPAPEREAARLMVVHRTSGRLEHRGVRELPELLPAGALLVVNDTLVRKMRLRGRRATGGAVELLLIRRSVDGTWSAMGRANKPLGPGTRVSLGDRLEAVIEGRDAGGLYRVRLDSDGTAEDAAIEAHGEVPLPPYIRRPPAAQDEARYQTVFARVPGAVAAPTAGLHLGIGLLERIRARGLEVEPITLHVGPGTFVPVTVPCLDDHPMHAEEYDVPAGTARAVNDARSAGRLVVAVGTTVVRALESAVDPAGEVQPGARETRLLLQPGCAFRVVDRILTNFHVPRSTLIALVMAFAGRQRILEAYAEAIRLGYRFYSYGDCMLIQ